MSKETGELLEEPGELRGLWRISDFQSLLQGEVDVYSSPRFLFLDSCWSWEIYLDDGNGKNRWLGLYLRVLNCDSPKEVCYSFSIKNAGDKEEDSQTLYKTFSQKDSVWGVDDFMKVSRLQRRKTELVASDVLTICYTLKNEAKHPSESSLFRRLWDMSLSFKSILTTRKRSDVTLKLKDGEIAGHRIILESRSPVFDRMLNVDMRESQTGEVVIDDATQEAFQVVVHFAYTGDPEGLSCENVCEVYKIAHKYEFEGLRRFCTRYMQETLCEDMVCDVMTVAHTYHEEALEACVKDFFAKNKNDIFKSEKWRILKKENLPFLCELLEWVFGDEV